MFHKLAILIISILLFSINVSAQRYVSDLPPAHAAALERFLSKQAGSGVSIRTRLRCSIAH
jgi:hypothetical protein